MEIHQPSSDSFIVVAARTHHLFLIDLGIATKMYAVDEHGKRQARKANMYYSTPYRPPEFWLSKTNLQVLMCLEPSADTWAAAATMFEAHVGVRLFGSADEQSESNVGRAIINFMREQAASGPSPLQKVDSTHWRSIIFRCLNPAPERRPVAREFLL